MIVLRQSEPRTADSKQPGCVGYNILSVAAKNGKYCLDCNCSIATPQWHSTVMDQLQGNTAGLADLFLAGEPCQTAATLLLFIRLHQYSFREAILVCKTEQQCPIKSCYNLHGGL